jgi:hypothetical protein
VDTLSRVIVDTNISVTMIVPVMTGQVADSLAEEVAAELEGEGVARTPSLVAVV